MSVTKTEFYMCLRNTVGDEFADIPQEAQINHSFSEEFKRKMMHLFEKKRKTKPNKKVILSLVAAMITLVACTVTAISTNNPVVNLVFDEYDGYYEVHCQGDLSGKITNFYAPSYIPKGFEEISGIKNKNVFSTKYTMFSGENSSNGNEYIIEFSQQPSKNFSPKHDASRAKFEPYNIGELTIYVYNSKPFYYTVLWIYDTYVFSIHSDGYNNFDEVIKIIESVVRIPK